MPYNWNEYNKPKKKNSNKRADHKGSHRVEFDKNRKKILATQEICGICGQPVNKNLKFPDPLSPTIDHIIPLNKGGHPSALSNLQLAHFICNRYKSDTYIEKAPTQQKDNRNLPLSIDWSKYKTDAAGNNQRELEEQAAKLKAEGKIIRIFGAVNIKETSQKK